MSRPNKLKGIKSKYIGVSYNYACNRVSYWRMTFERFGKVARKDFPFTDEGEKAAAKCFDMKLIEYGEEPVNILVRK